MYQAFNVTPCRRWLKPAILAVAAGLTLSGCHYYDHDPSYGPGYHRSTYHSPGYSPGYYRSGYYGPGSYGPGHYSPGYYGSGYYGPSIIVRAGGRGGYHRSRGRGRMVQGGPVVRGGRGGGARGGRAGRGSPASGRGGLIRGDVGINDRENFRRDKSPLW